MSAFITAVVNEDGIIEPQVEGTRMDPDEYAMRAAKIKVDPMVITALEAMGASMDEAALRVLARPDHPTCNECGADASWKAVPWLVSHPIYLCHDHQQQLIDKYESFDRI